jgi:hypothetical protein
MGLKSRAVPKSAKIQPWRQTNSIGPETPKPLKVYGAIDIDAGLLGRPLERSATDRRSVAVGKR